MRRRRGIMGLNGGAGIPVITATATGNPLSFITDIVRPLKSLVIPFTPIQEGSGNPSPDNVRPISGWTGATIHHAIPFDFDNVKANSYIDNNGVERSQNGFSYTLDYTPVTPGETYMIRWLPKTLGNINLALYFYDADKNFVGRSAFLQGSADFSYTPASGVRYLRFQKYYTCESAMVEYTTLPITFTDPTTGDPVTVYGGTVTLNQDRSADLVVTHRYIDVNPNNASLNADKDTMVWAQISLASGYYGASSNRNIYSNIFTNKGYGTIYGSQTSATGNRILVGLPAEYDTTNLVKQFFTDNPTQFVYKLASDQTYHFDNIGQLYTYLGTNTIWTDTNGTNTATYLKHQS